jgi:UDP-N-acetylmuramoyl-L-alanyl-D-glutamate--2,6-diaminopimelate ligase
MQNNVQIIKLLNIQDATVQVTDIHWKVQDSTDRSLLFYKLNDDQKSLDVFEDRIKQAKFSWLIVNRHHPALPSNSSVIRESEWPQLQKACLDILYPMPDIKLIAVTGTNGKTTTADLVLQLGGLIGKRGLSIGTLGVREKDKTLLDFGLTSPCLIDLRKFLFTFGRNKDFCVLEASSHALVQERLFGLSFDGAGWLSFSQDHLDYHKTMESYFEAKCLLLHYLKRDAKIFFPKEQNDLFLRVSQKSKQCFSAAEITDDLPVFFRTRFNRNNLEVAAAIISEVYKQSIPNKWDQINPPDGRFCIRAYKSNYIIVDFAHTPDALENICKGIKEAFPGYKLKVLFGCGGDRDRTKRPLMGKVAGQWADKIYLTSDNPRSEDPLQIIKDIAQGIDHKNVHQIPERPKAVELAFAELGTQEVLLLAGKGHEDYILINGIKHPYSDIEEVEKFISRNPA